MIGPVHPSEIDELAPMPGSLARLAAIVGDENADVAAIAKVIELDPALAADVLRLVNSAWSASAQPITSVRNAVVRLGGGRILELTIGRWVASRMGAPCGGYGLSEQELWRHAVAAALAAERLGAHAGRRIPGAAYTAALLHDIGKIVLNRHLGPEALGRMKALLQRNGATYLQCEREVLGTDHAEIGAAVGRHWELPEPLVHAIGNHHNPDGEGGPLLDAVHVANATAKLVGVGLGDEQMNMAASAAACERLGLSPGGLEALCADVAGDLAKTEELFGSA